MTRARTSRDVTIDGETKRPSCERGRRCCKRTLEQCDPSCRAAPLRRSKLGVLVYRVSPGNRDSSWLLFDYTRRDDAFSRIFIAPTARGKLRLQWNSLYSRCQCAMHAASRWCYLAIGRACVLADWNNTRELKRCNHDRAKRYLVYCAPAHTCSFIPDSGSDKQINLAIMLITKTYVV